jgi:hypothetical protein
LGTRLADGAQKSLNTNLPVVKESVGDSVGIGDKTRQWFGDIASGIQKAASAAQRDIPTLLQQAGLIVDYFGLTPNAQGDLLRVHQDFQARVPVQFSVGGALQFDYYFRKYVTGQLQGQVTGDNAKIMLHVTMGVDLAPQTVAGITIKAPSFYVADATSLTVGGLTAHGTGSGKVRIDKLADVDVRGQVDVNLSAGMTLNDVHKDHRLRLGDLLSGSAFKPDVNGSLQLHDVSFTAHLPLLGEIGWGGSWTVSVTHNQISTSGDVQLPDRDSVVRLLDDWIKRGANTFPLLQSLNQYLDKEVPVFNMTIRQLLGRENSPGSRFTFDILQNPGWTLNQLIHGQPVDLVHFSTGLKKWTPINVHWNYRITSLGIPELAEVKLDVFFDLTASAEYQVDLGISTDGFWIGSNTHFAASAKAGGGVRGALTVLGFDLAEASGDLGLNLRADARLYDPNHHDGRIYLSEIRQDILNDVDASFKVSLDAHARASFLWWDWHHDWEIAELVNYQKVHGQLGTSITGDQRGIGVDDFRKMTYLTPLSWPDGRLEVFAVGKDGRLYHKWQRSAGSSQWSGWQPMPGANPPARGLAVGLGPYNKPDVFLLAADGYVYRQGFDGDEWSGRWWRTGNNNIQARVLVPVKAPDGREELFAIGEDRQVYHLWMIRRQFQLSWNSPVIVSYDWSDRWVSLGGDMDSLAAGQSIDGRFELFAVGRNGRMYHRWQTQVNNPAVWAPSWIDHGGQFRSLSVASNFDGRLEVFALGLDNQLYHKWQSQPNSGFSDWVSLGGSFRTVAVALNDRGQIEVYAIGTDGHLWHTQEIIEPWFFGRRVTGWDRWTAESWDGALLRRVGRTPILLYSDLRSLDVVIRADPAWRI